jgi:alpha-galactosidase
MGFTNWNATGCAIDENLIRTTADIFVSSGLRDAGYEYVNIDDERDPRPDPTQGTAFFEIWADGTKVADRPAHVAGRRPAPVRRSHRRELRADRHEWRTGLVPVGPR